jgi:hypothetical protein
MNHGTCAHCARTKQLDQHGLVVVHMLAINVSRRRTRTPRRSRPAAGTLRGPALTDNPASPRGHAGRFQATLGACHPQAASSG